MYAANCRNGGCKLRAWCAFRSIAGTLQSFQTSTQTRRDCDTRYGTHCAADEPACGASVLIVCNTVPSRPDRAKQCSAPAAGIRCFQDSQLVRQRM